MTCIVQGFKTKKALREHLAAGGDTFISNPSFFPPNRFEYDGMACRLPIGQVVIVTNHPKRSWFAQIERTETGFKVT